MSKFSEIYPTMQDHIRKEIHKNNPDGLFPTELELKTATLEMGIVNEKLYLLLVLEDNTVYKVLN